jgi:hypothetical protein
MRALPAASVDAVVTDPPAGISFLQATWDHDKGGRAQWVAWLTSVMRECLRVLKPGGHALVWALPRTSHWTATAIEDAGFQLRDCLCHVFGSGFPKSLDVSKAIDKATGVKREVVGSYRVGGNALTPTAMKGGTYGVGVPNSAAGDLPITAPATDAAKQWQGFGTALKPASEHWWLARKPLEGTVAECVQAHGTGAINIASCRVGTGHDRASGGEPTPPGYEGGWSKDRVPRATGGRWPPNFLLSHDHAEDEPCSPECPVAMVDGQSASGGMHGAGIAVQKTATSQYRASSFNLGGTRRVFRYGDDERGSTASRFFPVFYCPKASKSDRGEGNTHPTVKNTALMRWLCRLITPPGGLILDPFAGSGSTGVAALAEGMRFLGIENRPEYMKIGRARLARQAREGQACLVRSGRQTRQ